MKGLTFRGVRKPYLMVLHRKRVYWAPRELILRKNGGRRARLVKVKKDVRIEEVQVEISAETAIDLRSTSEDFAGWLLGESEEELIFDDEPERIYLAVVDGSFDAEEIVTHGYGVIRFVCFSKVSKPKTLNLTTTNQTFNIGGQESTPWKSRTRFSVPQNKFELESNVGKIILNYDFIAGDVLEIDYDKRDVFLNGKDLAESIDLSTVWFELPVGEVRMRASHATELTYSERYY